MDPWSHRLAFWARAFSDGTSVTKEQWKTLVTAFNIDSSQTKNCRTPSCVHSCTLLECFDYDQLDMSNFRECFDLEQHLREYGSRAWKSWTNIYLVHSESVRTRYGSYAKRESGSTGLESLFGPHTKPTGDYVGHSLVAASGFPHCIPHCTHLPSALYCICIPSNSWTCSRSEE